MIMPANLFIVRRQRFFANGVVYDYLIVPPDDYTRAESKDSCWGNHNNAVQFSLSAATDFINSAVGAVYFGGSGEIDDPLYDIRRADPKCVYQSRPLRLKRIRERYAYVVYVYYGNSRATRCITNSKEKARRFASNTCADSYVLLYQTPGFFRGKGILPVGYRRSNGRWIRQSNWVLAVPSKWGGAFGQGGLINPLAIHRTMQVGAKRFLIA